MINAVITLTEEQIVEACTEYVRLKGMAPLDKGEVNAKSLGGATIHDATIEFQIIVRGGGY